MPKITYLGNFGDLCVHKMLQTMCTNVPFPPVVNINESCIKKMQKSFVKMDLLHVWQLLITTHTSIGMPHRCNTHAHMHRHIMTIYTWVHGSIAMTCLGIAAAFVVTAKVCNMFLKCASELSIQVILSRIVLHIHSEHSYGWWLMGNKLHKSLPCMKCINVTIILSLS